VTVAGDAVATIGPNDPGFFNLADYDQSTLRLVQIDLSGSFVANGHVSFLGQLRSENAESIDVLAAFIRLRPWIGRRFDVQVGRIPRTFGAFPRRAYGADNFLIGYPLIYQYLTSLRTDAVAGSIPELVEMRGRGWRSHFTIGTAAPASGVPLASAFHWDTGIQGHVASDRLDVTASVAAGSLSNPDVGLADGLHRLDGRVSAHPVAGLIVGLSGSRGPFLADGVWSSLPGAVDRSRFNQSALGADVEYSSGYYLIRAETISSWWLMPIGSPPTAVTLSAFGISIEGRYKIRPTVFVGARVDRLRFSDVGDAGEAIAWEAPVGRIEVGGGYSLQRNLQLKVSCQYDTRAATPVSRVTLCAGQALYWF